MIGRSNNQLAALLYLLDDPDHEVFHHVAAKLKSYGAEVLNTLENLWETTYDPELQQRLEMLIREIRHETLFKEFKDWWQHDGDNLIEAFSILSRFVKPEIDHDIIEGSIQELRRDIWLELNDHLTHIEKINVFNHVMFSIHQYKSIAVDACEKPSAFEIGKLFQHLEGNAITLSLLYCHIAQQLGLPVYGVILPGYFVLAYMHDDFYFNRSLADPRTDRQVIFYIDPYNGGLIFTRNEITTYLNKINVEPKIRYYSPVENRFFIEELIKEMRTVHQKSGSLDVVKAMDDLLSWISGDEV